MLRRACLTEGSIYERIRRSGLATDPQIAHASLLYDQAGKQALEVIHREYAEAVFSRSSLPLLMQTDTWRCSEQRVAASGFSEQDVNADHVAFLTALREEYRSQGHTVWVAGLLGPAGDAYNPSVALSTGEAYTFHRRQVSRLVTGHARPDMLLAATLPALSEALGLARAMSESGLRYILSFVVKPEGTLLDGISLAQAITAIDGLVNPAPAAYMLNCVHSTVALLALSHIPERQRDRIVGLQANTANASPDELDGVDALVTESPDLFAHGMMHVYAAGLRILGGCCGTSTPHIQTLAARVPD